MKRINKFFGGIIFCVLTVSTTATALGSPDILTPAQEGGYALVESFVSTAATLVRIEGCAPSRQFEMNVTTNVRGSGFGNLDALHLKVRRLSKHEAKGARQTYLVTQRYKKKGSQVGSVPVASYEGRYAYSNTSEIMTGHAQLSVLGARSKCQWSQAYHPWCGGQRYGAVIIKDFFSVEEPEILDQGLEVISENDEPVSKWRQVSQLKDSDDGEIQIKKIVIAPKSEEGQCGIEYEAKVDRGVKGDGFRAQPGRLRIVVLTP